MPALDDIRVLVVADSPLARAGLAALLDSRVGLNVVAQTSTDADLSESIRIYRPDALVWDMGYDPARFVDQLVELRGGVPALVLLANVSAGESARALLTAGARGLIPQDTSADRIAVALAALVGGMVVLHPASMAAALPPPVTMADGASGSAVEALTPRESEVLQLIAEGLPNKTIAARLNISEHTVKFHVNAILTKFGAQSRTDAVVRATRAGLIAL